jgi:hypothetical protein
MASKAVIDIARQAEALTPEEQLRLIALLAGKAQQAYRATAPRRQWREICGAAPYPLAGEDAQAWVSRTRLEDDRSREQRWSRGL